MPKTASQNYTRQEDVPFVGSAAVQVFLGATCHVQIMGSQESLQVKHGRNSSTFAAINGQKGPCVATMTRHEYLLFTAVKNY